MAFTADQARNRIILYIDHYTNLILTRTLKDNINLNLQRPEDVVQLVDVIKSNDRESLGEIGEAIRAEQLGSLVSDNILAAQNALDLVGRLWLFTTISSDRLDVSLSEAIRDFLAFAGQRRRAPLLEMLSEDFSSFLRPLLIEGNSGLYPASFLHETEDILRLLFPPESSKSSRRIGKISKRGDVDLEVQIRKHISLKLDSYPFWGERLAEIQRRYDTSRPKHVAQWYYDRRNRDARARLWIAIIIFVLTVLFGVISSVTGVLQVTAAWK